ncbi:PH domain-containing protein [Nocardia jejuensis]|uniref:PH domain-containing protein n=1 Tax=Nocardia jejuensis TaxID=328049 RepID=UPI001FE23ACB|nr:PH domain-containing protein [Nocardia jejuensis]
MLLVHPITELIRFIPVLLASLIAGARADNPTWSLGVVAVIVGLALTRWFTTTYRITPDNVELRTGLLQRKRLSIPRNRVRSVDVEADLLHRALGLAVLSIGTGQHAERGDQFKLDALDASLVPDLRTALLAHTRGHADSGAAHADTAAPYGTQSTLTKTDTADEPSRAPVEIAHWQPDWVRYAPLSLTGFAIIAPIVGLAFQYGVAQVVFDSSAVKGVEERGAQAIALFVSALIIALIVFVSLAACARYLMTWFRLQVVDNGKTLHIRHGLFTTRQTTLDLARLRGATVNEPLLLRMARAAELEAIMTGTGARQKILPQAPRTAVDHTLAHLLDNSAALDGPGPRSEGDLPVPPPVTAPLERHGPAAHRRRYTRALGPVALVAAILIAVSLAGGHIPSWIWALLVLSIPIAVALAWDRYRGLGHAVVPAVNGNPTWLITRSGSLDRDRDCLEAPGIIGWTMRQSFWQRRAGVATVVAASAAGKKRYRVIDLPIDRAWALIEAVTPGQLSTPRTTGVEQGVPM